MYPVFNNSNSKEYGFQEFHKRFEEICANHLQSGRAMIFAFILYDLQNPYLSQVLKNNDYWQSLNQLSGEYITVFSIHQKPKVRIRGRAFLGSMLFGGSFHSVLEPIISYSSPSYSSNLLIQAYFGEKIKVKYPSILFFQSDSKNIIDYVLIELKESKIEDSFEELSKYISEAVDTLKLVTEENKGNHQEIFDNVSSTARGVKVRRVAAKNLKKVSSLANLVSTILGLNGS